MSDTRESTHTYRERVELRLSPDLKAELKRQAEEQHRTVNGYVVHLIRTLASKGQGS